jgi:peptide/nickel transport system substrate-binding protein
MPDDMTRFTPAFPAVVSALLIGGAASAARPHYGGTLRIEMPGTIRAFDPSAPAATPADVVASRRVFPLVFETLVTIDPAGGLRPLLATSWQGDARDMRWRVQVRAGVTLHDGSILQASQVAEALRATHSEWQVAADGNAIVIEPANGQLDLPWELARTQSAIAIRQSTGGYLGTGPFRLERLEAGRVTLRAHDDYWGSRPFLDAIQIQMGRSPAEQIADLEGGRADMVSVQPADRRRLSQRQLRVAATRPLELFALVFEPHLVTAANDRLRRTLAAAIDRAAICRVVLQGEAEPADALLPRWLSGYAPFVLPRLAQPLPRSAVATGTLVLRVTASDATALSMAQRIAVNARDAGVSLTVQAPTGLASRADLRMVRLPIEPATPALAIAGLMNDFGPRTMVLTGRVPPPESGSPLEVVVQTERALLEHDVIVPIVHVPELYGLGAGLESSNGPVVLPSGAWDLPNVWLDTAESTRP